jgi:uncharacterized protein (DUF1330 family)
MTAYVIYEATITDAAQYELYKTAAAAAVKAAGGRYIARGGDSESFEGAAPARVVILEFADIAAASAWYHSEQYSEARTLRERACDARMFVVDGAP